MARKALLVCGIMPLLLYAAMNIFLAMQGEGYSSASQTVSELSAIATPTRFRFYFIATMVILVAFGIFDWIQRSRRVREAADSVARVWERISIGVFLLWVVVLAVAVLPVHPVNRAQTAVCRVLIATSGFMRQVIGFVTRPASFTRFFNIGLADSSHAASL
jgi:hypothetical protein